MGINAETAAAFLGCIIIMYTGVSFEGRHRSAKILWGSLSNKLKLVVQMDRDFGGFNDPEAFSMYGSSVSNNEDKVLPWHIRHPDSTFSTVWDLLQLVLLLLVCWYVPLRTGFDVQVELWTYEFWQDVVTDVYFILDLVCQFRSAYWSRSGVLVTDVRKIRRHYLHSWFLIDFLCVLPLGYVGYLMPDDSGGGGGGSEQKLRAVKTLRLLRMGKMLRLAKVFKMLQKYDSVAELKPLISLLMLFFFVFLAAHLLACIWFLIGVGDQIMVLGTDGRVVGERGSAAAEAACANLVAPAELCEETVLYGWVSNMQQEHDWWGELGKNATLSTRYITSMYGVFNALENGFTDNEKIFGIIADQIVGSVIYGGLAAVLSSSLIESQQSSKEFNQNYKSLKTWMGTRHVNRAQQNQVLATYSHKYKDSTTFDEEELLAQLPPEMGGKVMDQLYGSFVREIPYFKGLDFAITLRLTLAAKPLQAERGSIIMDEVPFYVALAS
jgi:hypothetical protein